MHQIYKSKGSFDLEYPIPIIIYSSLVSMALNILLKLLAFSNDAILKFKRIKSNDDIDKCEKELVNKIKIQLILFFIVSFIFQLFF